VSALEYLLGSVGLGLVQSALGLYCVLYGLGVTGQPRPRSDGSERPTRTRPVFVLGGVLIIAFGVWLAAKGASRP
jgi:hypothetical protein